MPNQDQIRILYHPNLTMLTQAKYDPADPCDLTRFQYFNLLVDTLEASDCYFLTLFFMIPCWVVSININVTLVMYSRFIIPSLQEYS